MAKINNTGVPSIEAVQLGSGIMQLAELDSNGYPKKFEDLGEVKDVTTNLTSEQLDYFTARSGLRTKAKSVVTQQDATLNFVMESINMNNLARFFSGETAEYINPAIAGVVDAQFINDGELEVNGSYDLRTANGVAYGITAINAIVVVSTGAVAMIKDTDYTVDSVIGTIFVKDTATVQGIITAGDGLQFTLTADPAASTVDEVKILSTTELNVAAKFILEDVNTGERDIYIFHAVTISADGDYNLLADEWAQLPMTGSIEKSDAYAEYGNVIHVNDQ